MNMRRDTLDELETESPATVPAQSTELVTIKALTPLDVFAPGKVNDILDKITTEVRSIETDISTQAGRAAVASLAYKVARSKTALDDMGKNLVAEWKTKASAVDAERRTIRERLDALKDEVRAPLTDWENQDRLRIAAHESALADIAALTSFLVLEPSPAAIEERLKLLGSRPDRDWQEFEKRASGAHMQVLSSLNAMHATASKREAERAELERHRREQSDREQRERDERIALEAAERARREAEGKAAAEAREAAEAARREQGRVERECRAAEDRARQAEADRLAAEERAAREAEQVKERAAAEQRRLERERADADARARQAEEDKRLAAAAAERARIEAEDKAKRDAAAAAERAEQEKQAAVAAEQKRAADAKAAEDAATVKREANRKHKARINNEALEAILKLSIRSANHNVITREQAEALITAIAQKKIPHVTVTY
jgi:hypothetical protein